MTKYYRPQKFEEQFMHKYSKHVFYLCNSTCNSENKLDILECINIKIEHSIVTKESSLHTNIPLEKAKAALKNN